LSFRKFLQRTFFAGRLTGGKPRSGLWESDHTTGKKKEIKEHAGVRKGLEAPSPENATASVLLSLPQCFSSTTSSFCYQRSRYPSPQRPLVLCGAFAYIASRLPIYIASTWPNYSQL
jgi:hypothetical protein